MGRHVTVLPRFLVRSAIMRIINMHEAKTHLSKLIDEAVGGKPFAIAKAGAPTVKVVGIEVSDAIDTVASPQPNGVQAVPFDQVGQMDNADS